MRVGLVYNEYSKILILFVKKFWITFLVFWVIGTGAKEWQRATSPSTYSYELMIKSIPKSMQSEVKDVFQKIVWEKSDLRIRSLVNCTQSAFLYSCKIEEVYQEPLPQFVIDDISSTIEVEIKKIQQKKFEIFRKALTLISIEKLKDLLARPAGIDVWVYRQIQKNFLQQGNMKSLVDSCRIMDSLRNCIEFLRQEVSERHSYDDEKISNLIAILSISLDLVDDAHILESLDEKTMVFSFQEVVTRPELKDLSAIFRSILFGFSISLLAHSFFFSIFVQRKNLNGEF